MLILCVATETARESEMSHLFEHRDGANNKGAYATNEDFHKLFAEDVNSLYLLSLLLTANDSGAVQCFVAGLGDCENGNAVFKGFARSWARRSIVRNAIRIMAPHIGSARPSPAGSQSAREASLVRLPLEYAPFANILALEDSERFVFVLSVLERYSDQDCSALLGTSRREVRDARDHALEHIVDLERRSNVPIRDGSTG
jgi:hypothetical protein